MNEKILIPEWYRTQFERKMSTIITNGSFKAAARAYMKRFLPAGTSAAKEETDFLVDLYEKMKQVDPPFYVKIVDDRPEMDTPKLDAWLSITLRNIISNDGRLKVNKSSSLNNDQFSWAAIADPLQMEDWNYELIINCVRGSNLSKTASVIFEVMIKEYLSANEIAEKYNMVLSTVKNLRVEVKSAFRACMNKVI
jgi:hypothetical protein